ncbi:glycoside hydrolase 5 family protein [Geminisphaera colitermitum]|uniref:glycoside hydrolase 5 family protein n=1 Tax=Geminisphaera colitermitum TaxID=1148786 RepID=UPI000158CBC0|nr:cellulase family glycosylhydrolase [Geminisphaera colitermitum]
MTLDSIGYFRTPSDARFIPVGANYWPASCGVEMWQVWPEDEIFADLDLMASLGFNTVRFFVRWPDFEPRPGEYDATMLSRLLRLLDACVERGLRPQPSLFVGWMSGGTFWPSWKTDTQNLFADPGIIERAAAYARTITTHLKPFAAHLCGIDLGNELDALPDSSAATPAQVREWCRRMTGAIRDVLPDALILSGCDHQQVIADTGWRLGDSGAGVPPACRGVACDARARDLMPGSANAGFASEAPTCGHDARATSAAQPGIDVLTMHGYPVPTWHPVPCGGLSDPLTQSLLPFYVKCARAFGPVMLQEFGTILTSTAAASHADAYLRAILPACQDAGANGYLWWCFKDIPARVHPYLKNHFESQLGLVDAEGRVKAGLEYFVEFARAARFAVAGFASEAPTVHLYWPRHYYLRDNPQNPGNDAREVSRRLIIADHLLQSAGERVGIVRGDRTIPEGVGRIVIAGAFLALDEIEALQSWVERGGQLLWHGPDPLNWAGAMTRVVGAEIADYHAVTPTVVGLDAGDANGSCFRFTCYPRGIRLEVVLRGARVLAADEEGHPLILQRELGVGAVTSVLADVEGSILDQWLCSTDATHHWSAWYAAWTEKTGRRENHSMGGQTAQTVLLNQ